MTKQTKKKTTKTSKVKQQDDVLATIKMKEGNKVYIECDDSKIDVPSLMIILTDLLSNYVRYTAGQGE